MIPHDARLIRRINRKFVDWKALDDEGRPRVLSQAVQFYNEALAAKFGCPGPALSVIVESIADPVVELIERYEGDGLAYFEASLVRGDHGERGIQPWPREDEPAHAVVFRTDGGKDLPGGVKKRLARHLTENWIVCPPRAS